MPVNTTPSCSKDDSGCGARDVPSLRGRFTSIRRCDYCAAACSDGGGGGVYVDTSDERPIPVFDGFGFQLVSAFGEHGEYTEHAE